MPKVLGAPCLISSVRAVSRSISILAVVALCGLAVGCVPIPKNSVVHYGVDGRLRDAASGLPISKRQVSIVVDGREFKVRTNRRGGFKAAPEMHHFWTWLGGPMWPDATRATVDIAFEGYAPYHGTFVVRTESPEVPVPADQDRLKGNYITLGDIGMKKRELNGAANRSQPVSSETNQTSAAAGSDG